jgi:DNA-binding transcriptional regulator PaaX
MNNRNRIKRELNTNVGNSIGDFLIAMLLSGKSIRRFNAIIREREFERYKKESVRSSLSKLCKKGYLDKSPDGWIITPKGRVYAKRKFLLAYLSSPFENKSPANTLISFDIPGPKRAIRDWLRNQIKIYNYKMMHQSLWLGPGPLPQDFLKRLIQLKIRENIKIFKVEKK